MANPQPILLSPVQTSPDEDEYRAVLQWPFADQPFFEGQVTRLLRSDVPYRVKYSSASVWVYRDPDGNTVGFGTLDVCREYERFTAGKLHSYIPVLAVNPDFQKRGHGRSIVQHLIAEAVLIAHNSADVSDLLFLDVYLANRGAIALYEKCGFVILNPDTPIQDPQENNEPYVVMARKVTVARA